MKQNDPVKTAIHSIITEMMDKVLHKVLIKDPFVKEDHHAAKPIYAALVPDEIFKGSHFERRFVTSFGHVWELLAQAVAMETHGSAKLGYTINGTVASERLRRIQEVLNSLEHRTKRQKRSIPNWSSELEYILAGDGEAIPVAVTCDLYIENSRLTSQNYAFELKGPLPNSDQTKVSKEKMFKLLAMNSQKINSAFYVLPYNPYGTKENYAWSFPKRWFNMQKDSSVLIGREFWDFIGGEGTYDKFILEINKLGKEYKELIYREFLGVEPNNILSDGLLE